MHSLNSAYVSYYNGDMTGTTSLPGEVASRIVTSDTYSLTLSRNIHNNAKDMPGYKGREEEVYLLILRNYTGLRKDAYGLVDTTFVLEQFSKDMNISRENIRHLCHP